MNFLFSLSLYKIVRTQDPALQYTKYNSEQNIKQIYGTN